MLQLKNIVKDYPVGGEKVEALRGIDLCFRQSEFVSILGPSGCGKTTLLNIIGGLDKYTSGDLVINGRSTKEYRDSDWDAYRNHSIGFVFQTYNLIPHQTVLSNVELALTLSGVSKKDRRRRAREALEQVGLGDQINKKPNQMSGGQMQRVAIARALVNDPDILLADEPTGALDTETSLQVMDILKEIARDRLIIMVTHNPDLANKYSTRIVTLLDGHITGDSNPYSMEDADESARQTKPTVSKGRKSMSAATAFGLSFNNLMTKRVRTLLTSFAGSIGIIGIALVLALSTGIKAYVDNIQRDTLSEYPIMIAEEESDLSGMIESIQNRGNSDFEPNDGTAIYSNSMMFEMFNSMFGQETSTNNLTAFKEFLDKEMNPETSTTGLYEQASSVQYQYDVPMNMYVKNADGEYISCEVTAALEQFGQSSSGNTSMYGMLSAQMSMLDLWDELIAGADGEPVAPAVMEEYDLLYGHWPTQANEIVLILDSNNTLSDFAFYALGLMTDDEVREIVSATLNGEKLPISERTLSYEDACNIVFKLALNHEFYAKDADGLWDYIGDNEKMLELILDDAYELHISGVVRPLEASTGSMYAFGYTSALTEYMINTVADSEIVKEQSNPENENYDVFSGLPFVISEAVNPTEEYKANAISEYFHSLDNRGKAEMYINILSTPTEEYLDDAAASYLEQYSTREQMEQLAANAYGMDLETMKSYLKDYTDEELHSLMEGQVRQLVEQQYAAGVMQQLSSLINMSAADPYARLAAMFDNEYGNETDQAVLADYYELYMPSETSESTLSENLRSLGAISLDSPTGINIYAATFESKDSIAKIIDEYNQSVSEDDVITYTDYVALLMSGITNIINAISYGLIAFVAISLVVSSIMIGIITYISVLERTKEIGILRAVGASKRDVSLVFNAETFIVGLSAGLIGIGLSLLLCIPINALLRSLTGLPDFGVFLEPTHCLILIGISVVLTLIAGLIPARVAAKKDPVEALRTE